MSGTPAASEESPGDEGTNEAKQTHSGTWSLWRVDPGAVPPGYPWPEPPDPVPARHVETLRLDVDSWYPQRTASGTILPDAVTRGDWIAMLDPAVPVQPGQARWTGRVRYRTGGSGLVWFDTIDVSVQSGRALVVFSSGSRHQRRAFRRVHASFRPLDVEIDHEEGLEPRLEFHAGDHPVHPAGLADRNLSIPDIYRRAGFRVRMSAGAGAIPSSAAGADAMWTDGEMNDALEACWSKNADKAQWAVWCLVARLHAEGPDLGGIMFDSAGTFQRQGAAVFYDSFLSDPPPDDPHAEAAVRRMQFWCTAHELGHCFNLAHPWQKTLGSSWTRLSNDPESRSLMNYPFLVAGGDPAYFADHEYRFDDGELLFLRHAPEHLVEPGGATWFDEHGFNRESANPGSGLELIARVNRETPAFAFLEPVVIELKLKNVSDRPIRVDEGLAFDGSHTTVVIKREGQPARAHVPFARYLLAPKRTVLQPGESVYASHFVSAGLNGWSLAEPGKYVVQAAVHLPGGDVVSKPLAIRVARPGTWDESNFGQDYFCRDVGRVLAFDGSRYLARAIDTLRESVDRFGPHPVSVHSAVALGLPLSRTWRTGGTRANADPDGAKALLKAALLDRADLSATTLGHIDFNGYVRAFADFLERGGAGAEAAEARVRLHGMLTGYKAPSRAFVGL